MTITPESAPKPIWEKVVISLGTELIKGYLETRPVETLDELLESTTADMPEFFRIRRLGADATEEVAAAKAKAIFYVKEFDGNAQHRDLHFYTRAPFVHGVWIRIEFIDGEVMEGLVQNTIRHVLDPGFFMRPTDPNSNNRLVYVVKLSLRGYRVLGLRNF